MPASVASNSTLAQSLLSASKDDARRARKRSTDRKSQRSHRERQKAYIQHLEESLKSFKEGCNADQRVAALLVAQEKLQKRCSSLVSQLSRVRSIVCDKTDDCLADSSQPQIDLTQASSIGLTDAQLPPDDFTQQMTPAEADNLTVSSSLDSGAAPLPHQLDFFDLNPLPTFNQAEFDLRVTPQDEIAAVDCMLLPEQRQDSAHLPRHSALEDLCDLTSLIPRTHMHSSDYSLPIIEFPCFPRYTAPMGAADRLLLATLEEARAEHRAGHSDMSTPSLRRILAHEPSDILAFRLFHYIKGYGAIPLHLLLSIFWVQYLYLRWHVLETAEAYALVPPFLRPTSLECQIPHRICINMLVWPDIRQSLIRDALTVDPENIGIELLRNLNTHWQPSFAMSGEFLASMDVYKMIERQAVTWDFWKVGPGFINKYGQYKSCDLG
ncbi:hypothetical protein K469DRAFT_755651 [Zopfia rhizophila CBS 207.26]|uniref:BZIP domain-containing protein n=1 Tax=Zopfia rhizophila CBS 207.26 TaxID=1314779 RepID=A0A6A6DAC8_9PEZI|nr:hypothetical protein K469DRAFT_755651 [Zopfia rhizophila CBS 207.26]